MKVLTVYVMPEPSRPPQLREGSSTWTQRSRIAGTLLAVLTVMASLLATVAPAQAADTDLHARMQASFTYPHAHGGAWYERHHSRDELGIHVGGIEKLAGETVKVTVHGAFVGRMRVSPYGNAHLYRRAGAPRCDAGDAVSVRTNAGTLVAYGTMRHRHHMM